MKNLLAKIGGALVASQTVLPSVTLAPSGGKLGFVIDATGSRAASWLVAQQIQREMFEKIDAEALGLSQRVTCFRSSEVKSSAWSNSADSLIAFMQGIECRAGTTQIAKALSVYVGEKELRAVVLIGDAFEDKAEDIFSVCHLLRARGVRVFAFLEGNNPEAETGFKEVAAITRGAFASFNSKADLSALCAFVASFAARPSADPSALLLGHSKPSTNVEAVAKQLKLTYQGGK